MTGLFTSDIYLMTKLIKFFEDILIEEVIQETNKHVDGNENEEDYGQP